MGGTRGGAVTSGVSPTLFLAFFVGLVLRIGTTFFSVAISHLVFG